MPECTLKQRIHDGDPLNIAWASLAMDEAELEARLTAEPADMVFVDIQHAPYSEAGMVTFCNRANALGVPPLLRIRHTRFAHLAGNYADLGPRGILVPMVETVATVDEAIENFYYPPIGKRSWGPWNAYGYDRIEDRVAYGAWWNSHGVLALQIETIEGVLAARALAKPGVDLFLFGSNDLSFSLEAHPESLFNSVEDCIQHVAERTAGTGVRVAAGMLPYGKFAAAEPAPLVDPPEGGSV